MPPTREGKDHYANSKSPGLVMNVLTIVDIIFDKLTVAVALDAAAPPKKPKTGRKDRHTASSSTYGAAEVDAAGIDPAQTLHLSISELQKVSTPETLKYIRSRYGNHAEIVIKILSAWEAYGELFSEWRAAWTGDTDEYRARRALQMARPARDFQANLTSLSNNKQKSWCTHAVTWIAWQQLFFYGNTWPLSTISIESRNARIKKYKNPCHSRNASGFFFRLRRAWLSIKYKLF